MTASEIAEVAQLVERKPSKLQVAGSRPVCRSKNSARVAQLAEACGLEPHQCEFESHHVHEIAPVAQLAEAHVSGA